MKTLFIQPEARLGDKIAAEVIIRRYKEQFNAPIVVMEFAQDYLAGLSVDFVQHDVIWPHMDTNDIRKRCADEGVKKIIVLHSNPPQYTLEYFARFQDSPAGRCWGRMLGPKSDPYGGPGIPKHTYFLHVFSGLAEAKLDGYTYQFNVEPIDPLPRSKKLKIAYHNRNVPWQTDRNIPARIHNNLLKELKEIGSVWELKGPFDSVRNMAARIKGCDIFVGCESGPIHVAAAVGVPVVGAHFLYNNQESHPLTQHNIPSIIMTRDKDNKFNSVKSIMQSVKLALEQ